MLIKVSPKKIMEYLDEYVEGQVAAKKDLASVLYLHLLKSCYLIENNLLHSGEISKMPKSNMLLLGPTGCGKTYMLKLLCDFLDMSVMFVDSKEISQKGFVGSSLCDLLAKQQSITINEDKFLTGIVVIDEFDKLGDQNTTSSGENYNRTIQYTLLTAVEGATLTKSNGPIVNNIIRTHNMLFLFSGNFQTIRDKRDKDKKAAIGFVKSNYNADSLTTMHKELVKAGIITELVGRISTVSELIELTKVELRNILLYSKGNVLEKYKLLFKVLGHDIQSLISEKEINLIVDKSYDEGLGARGINIYVDILIRKLLLDLNVEISFE